MPIAYLRTITGSKRSDKANRQLGYALAFVAGATNAGGFLAVAQYTSHMTGIVSAVADNLALGATSVALAGIGAFISFLAGAATSAILINWARRRQMHSEYALPLLLESGLLLCFGVLGANLALHMGFFVPVTVMLLCFIMGLQNAIITKVSNSVIRTTHVTGLVTDIGIELGKLLYWNIEQKHGDGSYTPVRANRQKLALCANLLALFFIGGVLGAVGFKFVGYIATLPLAAFVFVLATVPVFDDLREGRLR